MKCPYCNQEMQAGAFRTARDGVIYWMPQDREYKGLFLTDSKVEAQGGLVLGTTGAAGLGEKSCPLFYLCRNCTILLAKVEKDQPPKSI